MAKATTHKYSESKQEFRVPTRLFRRGLFLAIGKQPFASKRRATKSPVALSPQHSNSASESQTISQVALWVADSAATLKHQERLGFRVCVRTTEYVWVVALATT